MSNQIQHKLTNFEVQPPAKAWDEIEAALDAGINTSFTDKLYSYEQTPPLSTWQKITSQLGLHSSEAGKVVPFFKRYSKPLKYSTAVAAFVTLAILTSLFVSKKTVSEGIVNTYQPLIENKIADTSRPIQNSQSSNQISIARLNTKKRPGHIRLKPMKTSMWLGPETSSKTVASIERVVPQYAERTNAINYSTSDEKYMIYSDGDGTAVRLPKKLFDSFACNIDRITCKQKLKKLQEQVAASAMKTDFTGILDMLNKLEENQ
ncbi:MAG: hypothetical protein ACXWV9_11625 [Flavisolibacter sp.]